MWFSLLILPCMLLLDTKWSFSILGLTWPVQLSFVFLLFLFIKRELREAVWVLLVFAILAHAQGQMSLSAILLPYFAVLGLVSYLKKRLQAETYLIAAIWGMGLFFLFLCLQYLYYDVETFFLFRLRMGVSLFLYTLMHGIFIFVAWLVLDPVYDKIFAKKEKF